MVEINELGDRFVTLKLDVWFLNKINSLTLIAVTLDRCIADIAPVSECKQGVELNMLS